MDCFLGIRTNECPLIGDESDQNTKNDVEQEHSTQSPSHLWRCYLRNVHWRNYGGNANSESANRACHGENNHILGQGRA